MRFFVHTYFCLTDLIHAAAGGRYRAKGPYQPSWIVNLAHPTSPPVERCCRPAHRVWGAWDGSRSSRPGLGDLPSVPMRRPLHPVRGRIHDRVADRSPSPVPSVRQVWVDATALNQSRRRFTRHCHRPLPGLTVFSPIAEPDPGRWSGHGAAQAARTPYRSACSWLTIPGGAPDRPLGT